MQEKTIKKLKIEKGNLVAAKFDARENPHAVFRSMKALADTFEKALGFPVPVIPVFGSVDSLIILNDELMATFGWQRMPRTPEGQEVKAEWEKRLEAWESSVDLHKKQMAEADAVEKEIDKAIVKAAFGSDLTGEQRQHLTDNKINPLPSMPVPDLQPVGDTHATGYSLPNTSTCGDVNATLDGFYEGVEPIKTGLSEEQQQEICDAYAKDQEANRRIVQGGLMGAETGRTDCSVSHVSNPPSRANVVNADYDGVRVEKLDTPMPEIAPAQIPDPRVYGDNAKVVQDYPAISTQDNPCVELARHATPMPRSIIPTDLKFDDLTDDQKVIACRVQRTIDGGEFIGEPSPSTLAYALHQDKRDKEAAQDNQMLANAIKHKDDNTVPLDIRAHLDTDVNG